MLKLFSQCLYPPQNKPGFDVNNSEGDTVELNCGRPGAQTAALTEKKDKTEIKDDFTTQTVRMRTCNAKTALLCGQATTAVAGTPPIHTTHHICYCGCM